MASPEASSPKLPKLRVMSDSLGGVDVELDGKKLTGVMALTYTISSGSLPVAHITMAVQIDSDTPTMVEIDKVKMTDPDKDTVEL